MPVVIVADGEEGPLFATVHAGWRGMIAGIVGKAAAELAAAAASWRPPSGPSIGPCCFTVDEELRRRFEARFPGSAGAATVDLWRCARMDLEAAGVPPAAVSVAGLCTASDARFFSHRRDAGRPAAIWR